MPTTTINPQADIIAPIFALILKSTNVKSYFGQKALAENNVPPRFVWVPTAGTIDGPSGQMSAAPRSIEGISQAFDVHCWGASFDAAWQLLAILVTATRQVLGANYQLQAIDATPSEEAVQGIVITASISIGIPLLEVDLDQATYTTTAPTAVAFNTGTAVDGDGTLTVPLI